MISTQNIKAVIFDCDGVMFDSRQSNKNFYNHLLRHFGLPPLTEDQIAPVHMLTVEDSVRFIFKGTPHTEAAQAYRLQMDYTPFIKNLVMEPGFKSLLRALKPRCGLAVATNRSHTIDAVLELYGLKAFFDIVVSSLDVKNPKPHPETMMKILAHFSIKPKQAVYIGDSEVDARLCRASGVPFIAYKNDGLEADWHVRGHGEVKKILVGG